MSSPVEKFRDDLLAAWMRSDALFALVPQAVWRAQPIDLRHPILFYVGHLPAFAWNQIGRGALERPPIDPRLDALYARGIDPESVECAQQHSPIGWPTIEETLAYRDAVRAVLRCLPEVFLRPDDILCERGRVLRLVLEHEWMHHETLLYMLTESPPGLLQRPAAISPPEAGGWTGRRAATGRGRPLQSWGQLFAASVWLGQRVPAGDGLCPSIFDRLAAGAKPRLAGLL